MPLFGQNAFSQCFSDPEPRAPNPEPRAALRLDEQQHAEHRHVCRARVSRDDKRAPRGREHAPGRRRMNAERQAATNQEID